LGQFFLSVFAEQIGQELFLAIVACLAKRKGRRDRLGGGVATVDDCPTDLFAIARSRPWHRGFD
jgi:hypothetical protein